MKHGLMVKLYKLMVMRSKFYALQENMLLRKSLMLILKMWKHQPLEWMI